MEQPIIFDNINTKVVDELRRQLRKGTKLSIAAATFSIYAFEALKEELSNIDEIRFIFTSPTFNTERGSKQKREFYIPKLNRERTLYGSDFEIRLRNRLSQKAIARECAEWIRSKARFRSNITDSIVNPHLTIVNGTESLSIPQFNEFTTTELGCERGNTLNQVKVGLPFTAETDNYLRSFDELWHNSDSFKDVTDAVIDSITNAYKENSPEFIYFVTLYNAVAAPCVSFPLQCCFPTTDYTRCCGGSVPIASSLDHLALCSSGSPSCLSVG